MPITALYAGLLAFVLVALSLRVIGVRRGARISLGDGGNADLTRRIRAHANFAEYVPLALILMGLAETLGTPAPVLHGLGLSLLVGRLLHAYGLAMQPKMHTNRVAGMLLTMLPIAALGLICIGYSLVRQFGA